MGVFDKKKLEALKEREKTVKKNTIMIVDDEEAHLASMVSLLSEEYNLITARDGQEALEYIQKMEHPEKLSLIISDQRMPNLTGIELFERLVYVLPNTIRIILTGYIDVPVILNAINKAKIYEFILKPFEPHDLLLRVKRAIEGFDRQQALEEYLRNHQMVIDRAQELEKENKELKKRLEELPKTVNSQS